MTGTPALIICSSFSLVSLLVKLCISATTKPASTNWNNSVAINTFDNNTFQLMTELSTSMGKSSMQDLRKTFRQPSYSKPAVSFSSTLAHGLPVSLSRSRSLTCTCYVILSVSLQRLMLFSSCKTWKHWKLCPWAVLFQVFNLSVHIIKVKAGVYLSRCTTFDVFNALVLIVYCYFILHPLHLLFKKCSCCRELMGWINT